jgi:hypothetical protein
VLAAAQAGRRKIFTPQSNACGLPRYQERVTPPAQPSLEVLWDTYPVPHPDRSCELETSSAPLFLLLSRGRFSKLEESLDPLQCKIFHLPLPSHRVAPFLNKAGNFK